MLYCSPSFDLPAPDPGLLARKASIQCHYCNETGHKAANCPKLPVDSKVEQQNVVCCFFLFGTLKLSLEMLAIFVFECDPLDLLQTLLFLQ